MSIRNFDRPYNRTIVTAPGFIACVCGARAGYRLSNGRAALYRCPLCASRYAAPEWESEALPHVKAEHDALVWDAYVLHRGHGFTPEQIARDFRATFEGRVEQLEARYQAERAKRRVS